MKTIEITLKQTVLASLFVLFILGGNVSAKGTETATASSLETTIETTLQIEEWMLNESLWNFAPKAFDAEIEADAQLQIESWMISDNNWKPESLVILENTTENELSLDEWMLDENYWN